MNNYIIIFSICSIISYFIGAIPFGYIIAKLVKGIDIREYGSKNIGATNVARILGVQYFFIILLLDMLKGFAPVFFIAPNACENYLMAQDLYKTLLQVFCGTFALVGHIFPIYLKFRGGKGVATGIGIILALNYIVGTIVLGIWLLTLLISGYVSLSSIIASLTLPIVHITIDKSAFGDRISVTIFLFIVSIFVIIRHLSNIKRLIKGVENKLVWQKKS